MSHGHKRKTHLKNAADFLNEKFYELIYIFDIRWVPSSYQAVKKVFNMWRVLVYDFLQISDDMSFKSSARLQADGFKRILTGKHFMILFHFQFDVLYELDFWSLQMQKRSGLLIDFSSFKMRILAAFQLLKSIDGRYLTLFLNDVKCFDSDISAPCGTLEKYYGPHITNGNSASYFMSFEMISNVLELSVQIKSRNQQI